MSRRICVITGTRAEYGLLYCTMHELRERGADLQLIVTGAHLSETHGMTVNQIESDGFTINARVDIDLQDDSPTGVARSMGLALSGIAGALEQLKPEIVVVFGDRYEMLAAASAAALLNIPIAHIHGGDVTEGAIDDAMRHAITKLSYWHFPSTEPYAERLIQLGEEPSRVFTVGEPGLDNLARLVLFSREELEAELKIPLIAPVILFTYHPETLSDQLPERQIATVAAALRKFPDATLIISGANADSGGQFINQALESFAASRSNSVFRLSFGSLLYLSAMKLADAVVGNSSSGVIEAPAMGIATVNIGRRQTGRLRTASIIDCDCNENAIAAAIAKALSPEFRQTLHPTSMFGMPGRIAPAIASRLLSLPLPSHPRKKFYDVAYNH